ncbi:hypothetical protein CEXT_679351 [Caerostris extrusa]|uniref:Uncharacterized protein n=1 Tax=Caerostris extrusa TaxID=172846 RepID=A0AAV4SMW9_CAEEX|nr:hypothetical protein CEXT_679351 [Caerostris extrusa]
MVEHTVHDGTFLSRGKAGRNKTKAAAFFFKSFRSSSICNAFSSATEICPLYFQNNANISSLVAAAAPFLEKGGME